MCVFLRDEAGQRFVVRLRDIRHRETDRTPRLNSRFLVVPDVTPDLPLSMAFQKVFHIWSHPFDYT